MTDIRRAVEKRLASISPSLPTAYEAVKFTPPDTMYQVVNLLPRKPVDPVYNTGYHREDVQLQVFVIDKVGDGVLNAVQRAELIRDTFAKGTLIVEGSTNIFVLSTPAIAGNTIASDRLVVPILIDLTAEVVS